MLREQSIKIKSKLNLIKGKPDLTPLVDVLFLLLIFFMLSSSFVQLSGITVEVPKTSKVTTRGVLKMVVIVDKYGNVFFNDIPIKNLDDLRIKFDESHQRGYKSSVIVRADTKAPFGIVAQLISLANERKLSAFIETTKREQHKPIGNRESF
jgi:biopolymer transport protein ExbD